MFDNLITFFKENRLLLIGIGVLFLVIFLLIVFWPTQEEPAIKDNLIFCPLRQKYFDKYDSQRQFSEEYQRIRLIIYFLKKGYSKSTLRLEYPLERSFGHKGKSKVKILVDLVAWKEGKLLVVAEVKKSYRPEWKKSAIEHQLKPAMSWTGSKYGIYWDGSSQSCCLIRKADGSLGIEKFPE